MLWVVSAWFLLAGALIQFGQSIGAWIRETNAELIDDARVYQAGLDVKMKRLVAREDWDAFDATQDEHLASHMSGRNALTRRHLWRYAWNAAGWLTITVGAALNLLAAHAAG